MKSIVKNNADARNIMLSTPVPKQTRTYKPVSHKELIELTLESIYQSGYKLESQSYSTARDGNVANGRYTISDIADSEMKLQIGWQNSYDRSLSLKFALGTSIIICSNGMVKGDHGAFKKKHQGDIQTFTPSAISEYIKGGADAFQDLQKDREMLKQYEATEQVQAELLGRMYIQEEIITSTQLNIIKREIKQPTHDYNANGSLWELYNHITFAMKEAHPTTWMQDHINVHNFFLSHSDVIIQDMQREAELTQVMGRQISIFDFDEV
jgi:hypothetical protein